MFNRNEIIKALSLLNDKLKANNIVGCLCICGGSAMVLAFNARQSTKDIDSIYEPTSDIRDAAQSVAEDLDLPSDWINRLPLSKPPSLRGGRMRIFRGSLLTSQRDRFTMFERSLEKGAKFI